MRNTSKSKKSISMRIKGYKDPIKLIEKILGGPMTFGDMIGSTRYCDEVSQVDLARKMKISRARLCDIEKGRRSVTPEMASRFAEALGYSVTVFVKIALEDQLRKLGLKMTVEVRELKSLSSRRHKRAA